MGLVIRSVAQSHVGLIRQGNEDSGYAGPRLLVVADGMGGHAAGEVASAVTVEALAALDGPGPAPGGPESETALVEAITTANHRIRDLVSADPTRSGMGTTVTALLWTGTGFSLAHIGDSRAYLLRRGELVQLTRDHTYVQALIDEGRLPETERETHPARSLLLQALGGEDVTPDLAEIPAQDGDRLMLCSDGLSGVVSAEALRAVLTDEQDPQDAADRLVELAVQAGGPDNITCVVADVRASEHEAVEDDTTEAHLVGAAAIGAGHPDALRYDGPDQGDDAETSAPATATSPGEDDEERRYAPRRRSRWRLLLVAAIAGLVVVAGVLGIRSLSTWYNQQHFVGIDGEDVVIRQGLPGFPGSTVETDVPDLPLAALPEVYQEDVRQGIRADTLSEAELIADRLRREACRANNAGPQISGFPGLSCESAQDRQN
jgi:protein phosphatase